MPLSLKNSDLGEGLYAGGPTLIKKLYFNLFDYDGTVKPPQVCLAAVMQSLEDPDADEFIEQMSCGKGKVVVNDGRGIDNAKGAKQSVLSASSKAGRFLRSLFKPLDDPDNGFPEDKVDDDITVMAPIEVNLTRKEMPKFDGAGGGVTGGVSGQRADKGPKTVLLATEITKFPWDKKKGKAVEEEEEEAAPVKKKKAAPAEEEEEPEGNGKATPALRKRVVKLVVATLSEAGGPLTSMQVGKAVFKALKGDDEQEAASRLVHDEEFLGDDNAPWNYNENKDTLTL